MNMNKDNNVNNNNNIKLFNKRKQSGEFYQYLVKN